jgi:hypothetical protein
LFDLTTIADGSVAYNVAAATKNSQHSPGVNFIERGEISQGNGNNQTMVAVQDKTVPIASNTVVDGLFDKTVEWAVIGLAINPAGTTSQTSAPLISSTGFNEDTDRNEFKMLPRKESNEIDEKMLSRKEAGETDEKMLSRKSSSETDKNTLSVTKSGQEVQQIPQKIALMPNYPNPFNLETQIEYALPGQSWVRLVIYNIRGQQVRKLVDESQSSGFKNIAWNGRDDLGREVGSGIYFIQLVVHQRSFVRKISLQK